MTWFTETPWPLVFILAVIACIMLAAWSAQKRGIWIVGSLAAILAAVAVVFVERTIVTESERVEQSVLDLTRAFQRKDHDRTLSFISLQAPELRKLAEAALADVDVRDDLSVKDMHVRLTNEDTRAVSRFRANGTIAYKGMNFGTQPSLLEVTWRKEGGDWKVIEVRRFNPIKENEEMRMFEQRPH